MLKFRRTGERSYFGTVESRFKKDLNLQIQYLRKFFLNRTMFNLRKTNCGFLNRDSPVKFMYSEKARNFCEISTVDLSYVVLVKSTVEITQKFVAFSEYINYEYRKV